jgi:hypothetical protein
MADTTTSLARLRIDRCAEDHPLTKWAGHGVDSAQRKSIRATSRVSRFTSVGGCTTRSARVRSINVPVSRDRREPLAIAMRK